MMDERLNLQGMADILKGIVLDTQAPKAERLQTLNAIKSFERCMWRPIAMVEAFDATGIKADGRELSFNSENVLGAIASAISYYMQAVGCRGEVFDELLSMEGAAEYLGISLEQMRTYAIRQRRITGKRLGRDHLFTREQLDSFREEMKEPGNPNFGKKDEANNPQYEVGQRVQLKDYGNEVFVISNRYRHEPVPFWQYELKDSHGRDFYTAVLEHEIELTS
jgi:hypothetical protein